MNRKFPNHNDILNWSCNPEIGIRPTFDQALVTQPKTPYLFYKLDQGFQAEAFSAFKHMPLYPQFSGCISRYICTWPIDSKIRLEV